MAKAVEDIINIMSPTTLEEMDSVALMKRTDTKFVISASKLPALLTEVSDQYRVLEINNKRIMSYSSQYFDTPSKDFYHDHHNGKVNRMKVRIRKYVDSDITFLEIKQKDGKGYTTKSRTKIEDFEDTLSSKSNAFIQNITSNSFELKTSLFNNFDRITLVNKYLNERVTIDLCLSFALNNKIKTFDEIVIIEVKQEGFNRNSPIVKALRNTREHPYSISKYCIGMLQHYQGLKYNQFKKKILKLNKLSA